MSIDLNQILTAVNAALNVIKTVANTPGVNIIPYAAAVSSAISAIQTAEAIGMNIAPYVTAIADTFSGGVPTQEQLDALNAKITDLETQVQAPLPPKEEGEGD